MAEFLKRIKVALICTGITVVWSAKIIVTLIKRLPNVLKSYSIVIFSRIARMTNNRFLIEVAKRNCIKFLEKE